MSKKQKTRLHETVPPIRPVGGIIGLTERDPEDPECYTWYNLSSAIIDEKGQIIMRAAGQYRTAESTLIHWNGRRTIPPDHPDYQRFLKAIDQAKTPG
jgi:hypothetical protein